LIFHKTRNERTRCEQEDDDNEIDG